MGDDPLPFYRLMTNDDPDLFRGYRDFRWFDRGMTALSIEYRWPLWTNTSPGGMGLDGYLLADFGQVFGHLDQVSIENLTSSYGFGFRLMSAGGFLGRLEFGWSEEDFVLRLRGDQVFQFSKGILYDGKKPVPVR